MMHIIYIMFVFGYLSKMNPLMPHRFYISTDKEMLNIPFIQEFLNQRSYWAQKRSLDIIQKSIQNSLCFGVYKKEDHSQVGFARVVTDKAVFGWILDVFIIEEYRRIGLSKMLMHYIMEHPELQGMQRWGLCTDDAHGLYQKFGFRPIAKPENMMEKVNAPVMV